ncbi:MAG: hypothetical protein ABIG11_04575 [bacterium]
MNESEEQEKLKKGGFLAGILRFLGLPSSSASGMGSGIGAGSGGLFGAGSAGGGLGAGGIFASKAGIIGVLLGGATIAVGVGVLYNFMGPFSKPAYSPGLFQNSYYEALDEQARQERASGQAASADSASLDYFREEAAKDNITGLAGSMPPEGEDGNKTQSDPSASSEKAGQAVSAAINAAAARHAFSGGLGMGGPGGGASRANGGISGEKGGSSRNNNPALNTGKTLPVGTVTSAKVIPGGKGKINAFSKKGAFGQAKFAKGAGQQAVYSGSSAGAKNTAETAFSGETTASGDVAGGGVVETGKGVSIDSDGGGGVADLKTNDPSLNLKQITPGKPSEEGAPAPWKPLTDKALIAIGAAIVGILAAMAFKKLALTHPAAYYIAAGAAYAAIAAGAYVIYLGAMMWNQHEQMWMGIGYIAAGAALIYQAIKTLTSIAGPAGVKNITFANKMKINPVLDRGITMLGGTAVATSVINSVSGGTMVSDASTQIKK